jgi:hypothetical protein
LTTRCPTPALHPQVNALLFDVIFGDDAPLPPARISPIPVRHSADSGDLARLVRLGSPDDIVRVAQSGSSGASKEAAADEGGKKSAAAAAAPSPVGAKAAAAAACSAAVAQRLAGSGSGGSLVGAAAGWWRIGGSAGGGVPPGKAGREQRPPAHRTPVLAIVTASEGATAC